VAQVVERLPSKCVALIPNPRTARQRNLFGSQFWKLGRPRAWHRHLARAFVLFHPMAGRQTGKRVREQVCRRGLHLLL
jgi:hypothetical protein